jgi:hypothetical protein
MSGGGAWSRRRSFGPQFGATLVAGLISGFPR